MFKFARSFGALFIFSLVSLALSACQQERAKPATILRTPDYPLINVLTCLPRESVIIAAHRATSRNWDIPENSLEGLERLINERVLMAEVDVAGLRDGTHILFHDGIWDEKSTGKGPVVRSTRSDIDSILLNKPNGALSAQRPTLLSEALKLSKDKIFLEIDFKSSSKYETVIKLIRKYGMDDQVILIGYTDAQSKKLQRLAPDMMVSAPGNDQGRLATGLNPDRTLIWIGRKINLVSGQTNALGYIGAVGRPKDSVDRELASRAKILVTDWADNYPQTLGDKDGQAYFDCLNRLSAN